MRIYSNIPVTFAVEDSQHYDVIYDEYIYTNDGLFKKYKKHFYQMDICEEIEEYTMNNDEFFVQKQEDKLNKNKIITTIPYKHYYVKRKTMTTLIDDDLTFVKEVDNDVFETHYFVTDNSDYSMFEKISSFLKNNV